MSPVTPTPDPVRIVTDTDPQPGDETADRAAQISDEKVRELLARRVKALGPSIQESALLAGLLVELLERRAAVSAAPPAEYQWGTSDMGYTYWRDSEETARAMARKHRWQVVRRTKAGPTEVVE